ncbi:nucleotidyltransferase domain-containing protein [Serpentinicella sp. ANB-PHB4]|uniref:nucleotidyltransferase family protein n=1 Tax=Serpentinicella sp. ANB-PHB4 TaxID=3074076 RepID=UPI002856251A|nr:nucleotidyltransferase domain-containing protein [Serpentinicella sp. ANB-PHB4]MDR5659954.1 nucleotidyltransferase domain-containing protein [Serpentinicella sp. ANB-PHB4]
MILLMDHVLEEIKKLGESYGFERVVLFGSRARGDHSKTSDYDIAVFGQVSLREKAMFCDALEEINTLNKFDVVFTDDHIEEKLLNNIVEEGVVIYEQT